MTFQLLESGIADAVRALNALEQTLAKVFPLATVSGSSPFTPGLIGAGAQISTTVTVTGAALGQYAVANFSLDLQLVELAAYVSAPNTVTCLFKNGTGGGVTLAAGTLSARVFG
jgi:hypothetical protein